MIDDVCRCFVCGAETGCKHLEPELRTHMSRQTRLNALTGPQDAQEELALRREYTARVVKHRRYRRPVPVGNAKWKSLSDTPRL